MVTDHILINTIITIYINMSVSIKHYALVSSNTPNIAYVYCPSPDEQWRETHPDDSWYNCCCKLILGFNTIDVWQIFRRVLIWNLVSMLQNNDLTFFSFIAEYVTSLWEITEMPKSAYITI